LCFHFSNLSKIYPPMAEWLCLIGEQRARHNLQRNEKIILLL